MRAFFNFAIVVLIGYGALLALLYFFQSRLIYFPNLAGLPSYTTPTVIGLPYEEVRFRTSDNVELHGWYVPAAQSRGVLLFLHGNAGNISHRLDSIQLFHELDLAVFIFDYRGYGKSQGRPTEEGTYRDAQAAWEYLIGERQLPAGQIVIFGRSLGAAIAAHLAANTQPAALIIESAFTSATDVASEYYWFLPVRLISRFHYDTRSQLEHVSSPLLVVHSADDEIISFKHGQRLFASAQEPKSFLQLSGGHNDGFFVSGSVYRTGLADFLDEYLTSPGEIGMVESSNGSDQ